MAGYGREDNDGGNAPVHFWGGIVLLAIGIFLILQNTRVSTSWYVWRIGGFGLPTGTVVIPLLIGVGILFYNSKSVLGRVVVGVGLAIVVVTVIFSVNIIFLPTSLFNYLLMGGCIAAGVGLLVKGLLGRRQNKTK